MKLVFISDTHQYHNIKIPDGDILFHSGDFCKRGSLPEVTRFNEWLGKLPHKHKVVIAGNHDRIFETQPGLARVCLTNATYLQDSEVAIEGLRIWGSPWQPWFHNWSFNLDTKAKLKQRWDLIPDDADIVLTHGPAYGIHDRNREEPFDRKERTHCGCTMLRKAIRRVQPKVFSCGHIHEGYGQVVLEGTHYVNASICDGHYQPRNAPVVIELP